MRLFVATDLPHALLEKITEIESEFRKVTNSMRWVRPSSMHLTLKFLGDVAESRVTWIDAHLRAIHVEPFQVNYYGVGFFPNARVPRVLSVSVSSEALEDLAHKVEERMVELGFLGEKRQFRPHLTMARIGRDNQINHFLIETVARYADRKFGVYATDRFYLFHSILRTDGAEHQKLFEYPL